MTAAEEVTPNDDVAAAKGDPTPIHPRQADTPDLDGDRKKTAQATEVKTVQARDDGHSPKTASKLSDPTPANSPAASRSSRSRTATAKHATRDHAHDTGSASSRHAS
jgi:hypothetical protein